MVTFALLGVALFLQVVIAILGLRAAKILMWNFSPVDLTTALLHHTQMTPVPSRCMRAVSGLDADGVQRSRQNHSHQHGVLTLNPKNYRCSFGACHSMCKVGCKHHVHLGQDLYTCIAQIWNLCYIVLIIFIFACFFTSIALRRPHGPESAAYGHLQALANLVDDKRVIMPDSRQVHSSSRQSSLHKR